MSMLKRKKIKYDDGRTVQSFKDQCDINKMIKKAQITNATSHAVQFPPEAYGEFDGVDLLGAYERQERAYEIFDALPSEVRREFKGDAFEFVKFAANPENNDKLARLIPAIAEPGAYFPNPVQRGGAGAGAATPPADGSGSPADPAPVTEPQAAEPPSGS